MRNVLGPGGRVINSVWPATSYLTFGPWIYLVPQFQPVSVLMLGYAGGTAAGLIKKLYGPVPITAVDIEEPDQNENLDLVHFVQADARQFVKSCDHFEVAIVDLWEYDPPDFVFSDEFARDVAARCDYLIVHHMDYSDMSAYAHLHHVRTLGLDYGARFSYFMVNRVARLPVR